MASRICWLATGEGPHDRPLFVMALSELPSPAAYDYDDLLPFIFNILEDRKSRVQNHEFELLVFCAGGTYRPSWPWLMHAFTQLDRNLKKDLQQLILVSAKSWVRVALQLLDHIVSPKFVRKIRHVQSLAQLSEVGGQRMATINVPLAVRQYDEMHKDERSRSIKRIKSSSPRQASTSTYSLSPQNPGAQQKQRPALPPSRNSSNRASPTKQQVDCPAYMSPAPALPPRRVQIKSSSAAIVIHQDAQAPIQPHHKGKATKGSERDKTVLRDLERTLDSCSEVPRPASALQPSVRSSSAPVIYEESTRPKTSRVVASCSRNADTLRRAISGPLTPSSGTKQNYLPMASEVGTIPKLTVRGKQVTVKTTQSARLNSKVGGLKALFEERAAVVQNMR